MQGQSDRLLEWIPASSSTPVRGVALVVHGLNLKPVKMKAIIEQLTMSGIDVFNCSLRGHGRNFVPLEGLSDAEARLESLKRVSYSLWRREMHAAYQRAADHCSQLDNVPLFFVGYSLGGAMGYDLFQADAQVIFDKITLFSPALSIRPYSYVFRLLAPFPHLVIPSASPPEYRANPGTSIAAYSALYAAIRDFGHNIDSRPGIPTLIFMDKKDELVSYRGISNMINRHFLPHWELQTIEKDVTASQQYAHLIIDATSVGATVWVNMMEQMIGHLLSED